MRRSRALGAEKGGAPPSPWALPRRHGGHMLTCNAVPVLAHRQSIMGTPVVFFDMTIGGAPAGRIEMTLRADVVPKTAEVSEPFSCVQQMMLSATSPTPSEHRKNDGLPTHRTSVPSARARRAWASRASRCTLRAPRSTASSTTSCARAVRASLRAPLPPRVTPPTFTLIAHIRCR